LKSSIEAKYGKGRPYKTINKIFKEIYELDLNEGDQGRFKIST
jgi:hypothetical protein